MFLITRRKNGVRRSARLTAHALRDQEFMAFSVLARYGSCWNCSNQKLLLEYNVLVQCSYVRNWTWSNFSLGYHKTPKIARAYIFKKVLLKRHELQKKHSPEKRKLVLLTLSTLKHSVRHTVQYWTLTESPSLLGDGWEGRSHFKLLCICFVCEPFTLRWWASTLLPHKSTRHMQNRKIFTQLRLQ